MRIGEGYKGSNDLLVSVANEEILPLQDNGNPYSFYKFNFINRGACHVVINKGDVIYLDATQGFEMSEIDQPVQSFRIVESGISYNWIGAYV